MTRNPDRNAVQTRPCQIADPGSIANRRDNGQRPGPKGLCQGACVIVEDSHGLGLYGVRDVGDQRIESRPALGFEYGGDRNGVAGVGGKAIDGFGRQDDQTAGGESLGGLSVGCAQARRA